MPNFIDKAMEGDDKMT